jgi:hypothetical protein
MKTVADTGCDFGGSRHLWNNVREEHRKDAQVKIEESYAPLSSCV